PVGGCARLNNYWCVSQTFADPWAGSLGSDGKYAAFKDPRWSARAAAYDLRARYAAGQRTARAIAAAYGPPCTPNTPIPASSDPIGDMATAAINPNGPIPYASACPGLNPDLIAAGTGRGVDDDLGLFDPAGNPTATLRMVLRNLSKAALGGPGANDALVDLALEAVSYAGYDQGQASFNAWRAVPEHASAVARFEQFLRAQGVAGVLPTYQILRTGSDWRGCGAPFAVAPDSTWSNVVGPLRLIRDRVKPEFPNLEAMSGYRDAWQNQCMGGAENSAHRQFLALDLVPNSGIERFPLMKALCVTYNGDGEARNMGLGFYKGVRFHVDTWKHRTWANVDGQPLNVCNEEAPVEGLPGGPIPYNQLNTASAPLAGTSH
ncbi:MAG: hypothetical protein ACXW3D_01480, partial [Caulobacteraceae bacterium]